MRKKLTKAARSIILFCSQETDQKQAIHKLQQDLLNGPLHCFGCHSKCSPDFYKTKRQEQCNHGSNKTQPDNTDTITTTTVTEDLTENLEDTTNEDGIDDTSTDRSTASDSDRTDRDMTMDNDNNILTNYDTVNDTIADDQTVINTTVDNDDIMNNIASGTYHFTKINTTQYKYVFIRLT